MKYYIQNTQREISNYNNYDILSIVTNIKEQIKNHAKNIKFYVLQGYLSGKL